jgi:hypothetical protein
MTGVIATLAEVWFEGVGILCLRDPSLRRRRQASDAMNAV